jgi:hypothetical protein
MKEDPVSMEAGSDRIRQWMPMRWPAGPLEAALRGKAGPIAPSQAEVLRKWLDPALLVSLVARTPVNCLIVSWGADLPEDNSQRLSMQPLLAKAKECGLTVFGLAQGEARPLMDAGPAIPWTSMAAAPWGASSAALALTDGLWPQVQMQGGSEVAVAGPTTLPWVESNGALLNLARMKAGGKGLWLAAEPPEKPVAGSHSLAAVDAEVNGGRWIIALDDDLRAGLAAGRADALSVWKKLSGSLEFLSQLGELNAYPAAGPLILVSDFSGENEEMVHELMNLLPRRRLPFRAIERTGASSAPLDGVKAVFYADHQPPDAALRKRLLSFAGSGGVLLTRAAWPGMQGSPVEAPAHLAFRLHRLGKGTFGVAASSRPDPYELACDIQSLMGRNNDALRLFNGASMNCFYKAPAAGRKAAVHIVNYACSAGLAVSLYLRERYRSARFLSPHASSAVPLRFFSQPDGGIELKLPPIDVYGVVALEA